MCHQIWDLSCLASIDPTDTVLSHVLMMTVSMMVMTMSMKLMMMMMMMMSMSMSMMLMMKMKLISLLSELN